MENLPSKLYSAFDPDPVPIINFLQWLVTSYDLPPKPRLLDVGCGPGQMLVQYARLGWQAVGLEPDGAFYAEATEVVKLLDGVSVRPDEFANIEDVAGFHLVTAINGPFAYLLSPEEQLDALRRVYRALKPGGVIFLDIPNLLWFLKNKRMASKQQKVVDGQKVTLSEQFQYDLHGASFLQTNEYAFNNRRGQPKKFCKTHKHAIITFPVLAFLTRQCGFMSLRTYGTYHARKSERLTNDRIMVSARKPWA